MYDPLRAPDPVKWLAASEASRIDSVERYHRKHRIPLPHPRIHAVTHAVVETQIALGDELPVARALERLMAEGIDRHQAIHAIGNVLVEHLHDLAQGDSPADVDPNVAYFAEIEQLTVAAWRARYEDE
jgi:hypothetical protein